MDVSGVDVMDDTNAGDEDPRAAAEPENAPAVASAASGGVEAQVPEPPGASGTAETLTEADRGGRQVSLPGLHWRRRRREQAHLQDPWLSPQVPPLLRC